ncbi:MAG: site-2 protease family protein [Halieaceae bacterium]
MEYLLYGTGFYIFLVVALRVHRFLLILSFRLRTPQVSAVEMEAVPREMLSALAPGAAELRQLGFELRHFMTVTDMNAGIQSPAHASVYYHREFDCYADLTASLTPDQAFPYRVNFYTFYQDGVLFLTMNSEAYAVVEGSPSLTAQDAFALTMSEQLATHREGVSSHEAAEERVSHTAPMSPQQFIAALNNNYAAYIRFLSDKELARPEGEYSRLSPRAALDLALKSMQGEKRLKAMQVAATKQDPVKRLVPDDAQMITLEVDAFRRHDQIRDNSRLNRSTKALLLLATILLFGAVFGITWSLQSLLILIGVVLFHEMGHILAMYLCGYRDLQILFIPFFGAAALGKADNPRAWQKAFVSLMGPVPGILLGGALLWQGDWVDVEWVGELALILLVVNFLNLLPIMPLDGGQLLNTVLFNHHPRWQFGFFVCSVGMLALWALFDKGPLLTIFALMMVFQVPVQYRHMKVSLRLLGEGLPGRRDEPHRRVFRALHANIKEGRAFALLYPQARQLVERLAQIKPSWREVTGSLAIYLFVLLFPFAYLGGLAYQAMSPYTVETDWESEIAAAADLPAALSEYSAAGYDYMSAGDVAQSLDYLDRGREQAEDAQYLGEEYAQLLEAMTALYPAGERDAAPLHQRLIEVRSRLDGESSAAAAAAHHSYAQYLRWNEQDLLVSQRHNAEALRIQRGLGDSLSLYESLVLAAYLGEALGEIDQAEAALREASQVKVAKEEDWGTQLTVQIELADFYVRQNRLAEASVVLQYILDNLVPEEGSRTDIDTKAAWVLLLRGDADAARARFDAIYGANRENTEFMGSVDQYLFYEDGSEYKHSLQIAVSYWSQGNLAQAQAVLAQAEAAGEGEFMLHLDEYVSGLRGLRAETASGIEYRSYDMILAMATELRE